MPENTAARTRLERLRPIRRRMSFETFERTIPNRPGWKREYYDGMARVRPSWTRVTYTLSVAARPQRRVVGLRRVNRHDESALLDAFIDAFRFAPEYCGYPMAKYRSTAAEYVRDFFSDKRGTPSEASRIVVREGRILAAALVKSRPEDALLDCLFVRPECFRRGLATAVMTAALNQLAKAGIARIVSHAMLANEASLAWHAKFGFAEVPDIWVAQARSFSTRYEIHRLEQIGKLTDSERERLTAYADHWWEEARRLDELPIEKRYPAME
jgi:ribosomal protein S18 acetylase RimI-like enzyme